jgi:alanyl-tRNA synthetase
VNQDDPDVIEFWNIVFIQFNREYDGFFRPLSANHVDGAMGLERLVSVVQRRRSNYDTDFFIPILRSIQEISGARPYQGKFGKEDFDGIDRAYRVVADHIRTLAFSLSDGGIPDNVGRGYVIRRVLRRGLWCARKKLNVPIGSFFSSLLPVVIEHMVDVLRSLT